MSGGEVSYERAREYRRFLDELLREIDAAASPRAVLSAGRSAAEMICRHCYEIHVGPPGKMMLEDLATKLSQRDLVPSRAATAIRSVQAFGNFGAHAHSDLSTPTGDEVAAMRAALKIVVEWYERDVSPSAAPSSGPTSRLAKDAPHEAAASLIGIKIDRFVVERHLGSGANGAVFLGIHEAVGTRVAIKILHPTIAHQNGVVERFFNEARAVAAISHPGVIRIHDVGKHPAGFYFLVMELLEGETLHDRIETGACSLLEAAEYCRQAAMVLAATHARNIIHRDLKPENIFLSADPEVRGGVRVKILDFGVAKLSGSLAGFSPGTILPIGTPHYMAPEQWLDSSVVDQRADMYSLGCIAFEAITGRVPYPVSSIVAAMTAHMSHPIPSILDVLGAAEPAADALIRRLLAKDPVDRPSSMEEVASAFDSLTRTFLAPSPMPHQDEFPRAPEGHGDRHAEPVMQALNAHARARNEPPALGRWGGRSLLVSASVVIALGAGGTLLYHARSDSGSSSPDQSGHSLDADFASAFARQNAWRTIRALPRGPQITSTQVTVGEFTSYLHWREARGHKLEPPPGAVSTVDASEPVGDLTAAQAEAFCEAVGGRLLRNTEWHVASSDAGDIVNSDGSLGPKREWTMPESGETIACGNLRKDRNDDERDDVWCGPDTPSPSIGFRCARDM